MSHCSCLINRLVPLAGGRRGESVVNLVHLIEPDNLRQIVLQCRASYAQRRFEFLLS
jgi:hypothetical protein